MLTLFFACNIGLKNNLIPIDSGLVEIDEEDTSVNDTDDSATVNTEDTGDIQDTADTDEPFDTGDYDTGDTDTGDTGTPADPNDQDYDGDGFSPNQGDCNDSDPNIFPFTFDDCDGIDNDCDGLTDEDGPQDVYEPNNSQAQYYDLGFHSAGDFLELEGVISAADDYDHYEFYLEDGWTDSFSIVTDLHAISLTTDFIVELWLIENAEGDGPALLYTENSSGVGLGEIGSFEGSGISWSYPLGYDDSGYYQAVVYAASGAACNAQYQLDLELSYW